MNIRRMMQLGFFRTAGGILMPFQQGFDVSGTPTVLEPHTFGQPFTVEGVPTGGATPLSFLTVFGSDVLSYHCADSGVTIGASFDWQDQGSLNRDYTRATAATGPSLNATDATLNNKPTLTFNGTTQYCDTPLHTDPAPATTPRYLRMIVRYNTWTVNKQLVSKSTTQRFSVTMRPNVNRSLAGTNGTESTGVTTMTVGTWGRIAAGWTGSTADFFQVMSTRVTGVNMGNNSALSTVRRLGGNQGLTLFAHMDIFYIGESKRIPTAGEEASMDAWDTANVKAGLV